MQEDLDRWRAETFPRPLKEHTGHPGGGTRKGILYNPWELHDGYVRVFAKDAVDGAKSWFLADSDAWEALRRRSDGAERTWRIWAGSGGKTYAVCTERGKMIYFHRFAIAFAHGPAPREKMETDHVLPWRSRDNRSENLRWVSRADNLRNARGNLPGTKRRRRSTAVSLPAGISADDLPMYVEFCGPRRGMGEYFRIRCHPAIKCGLAKKFETQSSKSVSARGKLSQVLARLRELDALTTR